MTQRISDHNLDRLIARCVVLQRLGWKVVRPVHVDWFWRGYSIVMGPPDA